MVRLAWKRRFLAAQRPRAKPLGGSGFALPILAHLRRPGTIAFPPASRVGFSELLGALFEDWGSLDK